MEKRSVLLRRSVPALVSPSPIVELNRAVALAMAFGPEIVDIFKPSLL